MNRGWTDILQSKKLLELGLSPETADMVYNRFGKDEEFKVDILRLPIILDSFSVRNGYQLPAWSLSALLSLMPDYTLQGDAECCFIVCSTHRHSTDTYLDGFQINAAFEMVCWLLTNDYINKEK